MSVALKNELFRRFLVQEVAFFDAHPTGEVPSATPVQHVWGMGRGNLGPHVFPLAGSSVAPNRKWCGGGGGGVQQTDSTGHLAQYHPEKRLAPQPLTMDRPNVKTLLLSNTVPKIGYYIDGMPVPLLNVIPNGLSTSVVVP